MKKLVSFFLFLLGCIALWGQSVTLTLSGQGAGGSVTKRYTYTKAEAPKVPATGVSLNKTKLQIMPGQTAVLKASVLPATATDDSVAWSSSNSGIASVASDGTVTGKSLGTARDDAE